MALSEEEKRLLAQLEASLSADDPTLASTLQGPKIRKVHRRRVTLAGLVFIMGIAALIGGIQISEYVSLGGFVLMVASAVVATSSWQHVNDIDPDDGTAKKSQRPRGSADDDHVKHFMSKMEERWRKRQEEGL